MSQRPVRPEYHRRLRRLRDRGLLTENEYQAALAAALGHGSQPVGTHRCSFCAKEQRQVSRLIVAPGHVYICDECVGLIQSMLADDPTYAPLRLNGPATCEFCEQEIEDRDSAGAICQDCLEEIHHHRDERLR